ncbi:hypothetical protein [Methylobacterium sp. sgz302541]|uniref:hypothetical protein n=1 Tax=unclassified Methylobacterium TaxID=2615210 RepID=UPI003D32DB9C
MTRISTIRRLSGAPGFLRALVAARAAGRGLTAASIALLLVFLSALPDESVPMPPSRGPGIVSMKAAPPATVTARFALSSASQADADLPPGDGRELGPDLPLPLRLPVAAGLTAVASDPPPPVGSALPERPPKTA